MLELRDLRPDWQSSWASLIAAQQGATLFHQVDWLRVLQSAQHLTLIPLGILQDNRVVGLLPLFVKRYGPLRVAGSPFIVEDTPYLGPLIGQVPFGDILQAVGRWARQARVGFVRLLLPPFLPGSAAVNIPTAATSPVTFIEKHTHILDLTVGTNRLWRNLREGCRGAIKKAQRADVEVVLATTLQEVYDYYAIAAELYRVQGRRHPNPRDLFQGLWERFAPSKNVSLLLARHHGNIIGGVFLGHANSTIYYLDGASNPEGKHLQAANLLLWEAIREGADEGSEHFDFVGSDIPRLAQFKASFGGSVHPYWCVEMSHSRLARGLRHAYPRWKALVARWSR
jgi:CelD/BcsL family acetyltransferase involved in cellulose biosynthesis